MADPSPRWRLAELAHAVGVTARTIRFYQQQELLAPPERHGRVVFYGPDHALRLRQIAKLQARGYTLEMIRVMLGRTGGGWPPEVWQDFKERIVRRRPVHQHVTADVLVDRAAIPAQLASAVLTAAATSGLIATDTATEGLPPAALAAITSAARAGLDPLAVTQLLGRYHQMSREIADGLAQLFVTGVLRPALEQGPGGPNWTSLLETFEDLRSGAQLALAEAGYFALQAAMEATRRESPARTETLALARTER